MSALYFEKLSQFDRLYEPVSVSVPFAAGRLQDVELLVVRDEDRPLPLQRHVLARWPDGSVKWLQIHCQPHLPGNRACTLQMEIADSPVAVETPATVSVNDLGADGLRVDTGPLAFRIPRSGFWPLQEVALEGQPLWDGAPFKGFTLAHDDVYLNTTTGAADLEVVEEGPLRAVILVRGKHRRPDGEGYLVLEGRITAYAGKSYVHVEHRFLHTEAEHELSLQGLRLLFAPQEANGQPRLATGEGYYRTTVREDTDSLALELTAETLLYQSNEHFIDSFYGDFWADWRDERGGLTLTVHQAHQNFPKRLDVNEGGITCYLYPESADPAPVLQGMGKTHRIQLHFHAAATPLEECSVRSLQFQLPDRPSLPRRWYREHNPWLESFFPDNLPGRLISYLNALHDGRPHAMGMFHFGDAPDAGYTDQGRGQGQSVWVNNEYDRPHACTLFYGLTGQRRVLDSGLVGARHWLDVDFCHYSPDPLIHGGLKIHTRYHVTGGVTPSHEWTEGFLDYYFLTGRREGLEAAVSVAENILRHMARPELSSPGATAVREGGWALRALVGMWLGTGEERWKLEAKRIAEMFLDWRARYGALLAPYTSHTMPRVPFMISLTVNSLARYLLVEDDERIKQLIVEVMDDLIEHCVGTDGVFFYKELPSLQRTAPTPHVLEALTYAYRITGNVDYLKLGVRQFAALVARPVGTTDNVKRVDPSGAVVAGTGGGRIFADKYTSILIFAAAAQEHGLLDWYDYAF